MVLEYLVMIRYFSFYTWVLGNEFGSGPRPHPHTQAVIVTTEKMNFEEFKKQRKKETKIKIADIQRSIYTYMSLVTNISLTNICPIIIL